MAVCFRSVRTSPESTLQSRAPGSGSVQDRRRTHGRFRRAMRSASVSVSGQCRLGGSCRSSAQESRNEERSNPKPPWCHLSPLFRAPVGHCWTCPGAAHSPDTSALASASAPPARRRSPDRRGNCCGSAARRRREGNPWTAPSGHHGSRLHPNPAETSTGLGRPPVGLLRTPEDKGSCCHALRSAGSEVVVHKDAGEGNHGHWSVCSFRLET